MNPFPSAVEEEKAVLASFALEPTAVRAICAAEGVGTDWFYLPAHGLIWEAMTAIVDAGQALDFITLGRQLQDAGNLDGVGGPAFLNEFWTFHSAANVRDYLETLRDKRTRRQIILECDAATKAAQTAEEASEVAGNLHRQIGALLQVRTRRPNHREVLQQIIDEVREGQDDTGLVNIPVQGIAGRLKVYRGDLLMITAPTSCGKTALATQIALAIANTGRVAVYPLEMAQKQVMKRAIAQCGGNNPDFVRRLVKDAGDKPAPEFVTKTVKEFMDVARAIGKLDIHLRDDLSRWEQIRADIRMEHGRRPFTFVLIDYLQLIQSSSRHERRQLAIAEITQGAKLLAGELECVICMPSQVNQQGGTREAQDAENDASALIKIHPAEGKDEPEPGRVTVWKQREGQRHIELPLRFNPELTRFDYDEAKATP